MNFLQGNVFNYWKKIFSEKKGKDDEGKEGGRRRIGFGDDDDDVRFEKCKTVFYQQLTKIIRVDIPDGSSYSPTSSKRQTSSNGGKATQSTSRPKGSSKGGRRWDKGDQGDQYEVSKRNLKKSIKIEENVWPRVSELNNWKQAASPNIFTNLLFCN